MDKPQGQTGGWTTPQAIPMDYVLVRGSTAPWLAVPGTGFDRQDLGLASASRGLMQAERLRIGAPGATGWRRHDANFEFWYVDRGWMKIEDEHGDARLLDKGGVAVLPTGLKHNLFDFSMDFEAIRITSPASFGLANAGKPAGRAHYSLVTPDAFKTGAGPRRFFGYRDLGPSAATGGRIHVHVVKSSGPAAPGGTGWHYHSMSQWFMVLHGWATLAVEKQGQTRMVAGDCMTLGAGMRHDVPAYSPDYLVLEMCLPGEYETVAEPAPVA